MGVVNVVVVTVVVVVVFMLVNDVVVSNPGGSIAVRTRRGFAPSSGRDL